MSTLNNLLKTNTIRTICVNNILNVGYGLFGGYPGSYQTIYNNVFNYKFNQQTTLGLTGQASTLTNYTSINNSAFDNNNKNVYICGDFTLGGSPSPTNIAYLLSGSNTWSNLGLTFTGPPPPNATAPVVNCMVIDPTNSLLYIGGIFTSVAKTNTSAANFAIIQVPVGNPPTPTDYTVVATTSTPTCTEINSLIIVGTTIYAGGKNGNNIFFYKYDSPTWTSLLTPQTAGSINIIYNIPNTTILVIGGQFTSIGNASNCNNIVLYNINGATWTPLGTAVGSYGVTGVGSSLPINVTPVITDAVVYTVTSSVFAGTTNIFIGGYFKYAGNNTILCNSLVIYNYNTPGWTVYNPTLVNTTPVPTLGTGVYYNDTITTPTISIDPGIVYSLTIVSSDNLNLLVGGQFYINTNKSGFGTFPTIYNLFKVTVNTSSNINYPYTYGVYYTPTYPTSF